MSVFIVATRAATRCRSRRPRATWCTRSAQAQDWGYYGYRGGRGNRHAVVYAVQAQIRHSLARRRRWSNDGDKLGVNLYSAATARSAAATGSPRRRRGAKVSRSSEEAAQGLGLLQGRRRRNMRQADDARVQDFQTKHGLSPDGIVDRRRRLSPGDPAHRHGRRGSFGRRRVREHRFHKRPPAREASVYAEARGEPCRPGRGRPCVAQPRGQRAEHEIPSRKRDHLPAGRVQHSWPTMINLAPDATAVRAARDALNGWDPSNGGTAVIIIRPESLPVTPTDPCCW